MHLKKYNYKYFKKSKKELIIRNFFLKVKNRVFASRTKKKKLHIISTDNCDKNLLLTLQMFLIRWEKRKKTIFV